MFDLEDSVEIAEKPAARNALATCCIDAPTKRFTGHFPSQGGLLCE